MTAEEQLIKIKDEIIGSIDTITSLEEAEQFHDRLIKVRTEFKYKTMLEVMPHYRGEQHYGWDILPGIFRPPFNITDPVIGKQLEQKAVAEFERVITTREGIQFFRDIFNKEKHGKDWDLLVQAQHAGVRTTLTDWSAEIVSGLYFATEESLNPAIEGADGQLWYYLTPTPVIIGHNDWPVRDTFYDMDPFDMKETRLLNVSTYIDDIDQRIFEYRMYRQKGRFVMSGNEQCHIPLNKQDYHSQFIVRLRVPQEFKAKIREQLAERGVIRANMYVDEAPTRQQLIDEINAKIFAGY